MDVGVVASGGVGQLASGVGRKDRTPAGDPIATGKPNHVIEVPVSPQVGTVLLYGIPIVSLVIESLERLCLAQISNTLLKDFSYNEIHNRRVALGITCVQCTPVQLEILRRAGAMPVSSRRCGMITRREADRLCKSFLGDNAPPRLPEDFAFTVHHECAWGCRGSFLPARYNSSRAKCIKCQLCGLFFSPNKFIFHSHRTGPAAKYVQPDAANFNSWRRHLKLSGAPPDEVVHAWEDVKAMFNGGTRKRLLGTSSSSSMQQPSTPTPAKVPKHQESPPPAIIQFPLTSTPHPTPRVPPFPDLSLPLSRSLVMDYVWHHTGAIKHQFPFPPYGAIPWLGKRGPLLGFPQPDPLLAPVGTTALGQERLYTSAFRPVFPALPRADEEDGRQDGDASDEEAVVDIETTEEETPAQATAVGSATPWTLHREHDADPGPSIDIKPNPEGLGKQESSEERLWTVARLSLERQDRAFYRQEMARQLHIMRELATPTNTDQFYTLGGPISPHCHPTDRRNAGKFKEHGGSKMALDCSTCHQLYSGSNSNNNNSGAVAGSDTKITH